MIYHIYSMYFVSGVVESDQCDIILSTLFTFAGTLRLC